MSDVNDRLPSIHLKNYMLEIYKIMIGHLQTLSPEESLLYLIELKTMMDKCMEAYGK